MIRFYASLIFVAGVLSISCDPVRRIDMSNATNDSAYIIWTMQEDSFGSNPFHLSNSKELKFTLYPPNNEIKMSFGAGSWTPSEVGKLVRHLESLEIISSTKRVKIDSLPLLKDFLLARRKGVGGAKIKIVVTN